jgi:hypothetical protein
MNQNGETNGGEGSGPNLPRWPTRKFAGKVYRYYGSVFGEAEAREIANDCRSRGYHARVSKATTKDGNTRYKIWTRPQAEGE